MSVKTFTQMLIPMFQKSRNFFLKFQHDFILLLPPARRSQIFQGLFFSKFSKH